MRKIIALSVLAYVLGALASSPAWAGWTWDEGRADTGTPAGFVVVDGG